MIEGSRGKLMMALGEAIDKSPYAAVYGDQVSTHPELLQRFRRDLVAAMIDAIAVEFGTGDPALETDARGLPVSVSEASQVRG